MQTNTPFYVLSACRNDDNDVRNTLALAAALNAMQLDYKRVQGVYNGTAEQSFVVLDSANASQVVPLLAAEFDQESILHVDANRHAMLGTLQADGISWESLGRWHATTARDAARLDAFTFDPDASRYYAVT